MRKDEGGFPCPSTLGEYRDMIVKIAGEDNDAVRFLDARIAGNPLGRDTIVLQEDSQMRALLLPMSGLPGLNT
jgi:hypothetical protein